VSLPTLTALGWEHPRCMSAMRACAEVWKQNGRGAVIWQARSLEAFGDEPLEELAERYDLLVIDHPFCGTAARSGCLVPLDELLEPETLARLDAAAVGPSQSSYRYAGQTWALASDAACQVSARRDDLLEAPPPASWPEALELIRSLGPRAALPLAPAHAISSLLTLWAGAGLRPLCDGELIDPSPALEQLEWLIEMHRLGNPAAAAWEPPAALAALSAGELVYVPLTYGYVNYSHHSAPAPRCSFTGIPGESGSVLGGAGIAVSASCSHPIAAAAFAAWACGEEAQRRIVATNGGQPANAACWADPQLDLESGRFYSSTRATLEAAWVRPRDPWWPSFQLEAGRALTAGLQEREAPARLLKRLLEIHDQIAVRSINTT
jgi:multiple sugar transport system substrate-binding protein